MKLTELFCTVQLLDFAKTNTICDGHLMWQKREQKRLRILPGEATHENFLHRFLMVLFAGPGAASHAASGSVLQSFLP